MNNISNDYILNRNRINGVDNSQDNQIRKNTNVQGKSFKEVFDQIKSNDEITFSKHALKRLEARNIDLSKAEVKQISEAMNKARDKGVKDALIVLGDKAFVASVKNNTVITATTGKDLDTSVFTNIDGAVII